MTLPVIEQILQAVEARHAAITIVGLFTDRNRQEPVQTFPALVLQDGDQESDPDQLVFVQYFRKIKVEGSVRVKDKAQLGPALNALYAEAVKSLTAEPTLGGLAIDITEGAMATNMAPTDDSQWIGQFDLDFTIHYTTKHGDPYSIAP